MTTPVFSAPTLLDLRKRFSGVRVVADIHGCSDELLAQAKSAQDLGFFLLSLGDLIDYGPDSLGCLRLMHQLQSLGQAAMLLGNHDLGLLRYIEDRRAGKRVPHVGKPSALGATLAQIHAAIDREQVLDQAFDLFMDAPIWLRLGSYLFAHGCWHPAMDQVPTPQLRVASRAYIAPTLYGYTDGTERDGYPVRSYEWLDFIGPETTMVVGHDIRDMTTPLVVPSLWNGRVVFLDTGCGKGGRLSHLDIPFDQIGADPTKAC